MIGKNKIEQIYKEIAELNNYEKLLILKKLLLEPKLKKEIAELNNDEELLILKKLLLEPKLKLKKEKKLNIYNIKGIGKEIWKNIDAQNYVNGERETWK